MPEVIIYSRPGCHLCDVVERIARRVQADLPFTLTRMNVDESADLAARYGDRVPVVLIDQVETFAGKVTEGEFRRAIQKASRKGFFSRVLASFRMFKKPVRQGRREPGD